MKDNPPLSTLLSQALVAYTIEFDNEAERRLPHQTTRFGGGAGVSPGPWLASMAMWFNCMRWLDGQGLTVGELEARARTPTNLDGMRRWGYVMLIPPAGASATRKPNAKWSLYPLPGGRAAQEVWRPLFRVMEERWRERFGGLEVDALRRALGAIVERLDPGLPDCMPILGYGLTCRPPSSKLPKVERIDVAALELPALLARVLLAFALEFESSSPLSLAICRNPLRILGTDPVKVRDLPILTGVSKESLQMAMGILRKAKMVKVAKEGSWQVVSLTDEGIAVRDTARRLLVGLERDWGKPYPVADLRAALEPIVGDGTRGGSLLFGGLDPNPDGWRAMVRPPETLPHFPMVLHRGGYPDGS